MEKKINSAGQKAYQREDREDRSLPYRMWLRTVDTDGFYLDIDLVKWRNVNGRAVPVAITELTRCDSEDIGKKYLDAIIDRWYVRDKQGVYIEQIANALGVPAYLVLFQKDMRWIWVYSLTSEEWKEFTPQGWANFLKVL